MSKVGGGEGESEGAERGSARASPRLTASRFAADAKMLKAVTLGLVERVRPLLPTRVLTYIWRVPARCAHRDAYLQRVPVGCDRPMFLLLHCARVQGDPYLRRDETETNVLYYIA